MTTQRRLILAVALIAFALPLGAQKTTLPPPAPGKAQIVGVVVDSLNGRYLSHADVVIEGARTTLETDSLGKFEIDSLAPGTYQVGVFHPLLDTLGIMLATQPFHVGRDSSSFILLAVPSAATIIHGTCPVKPGSPEMSAVIGHAVDPETLQPVARAEVSVAWTDLEVSKESGLRRTSHLMRDSTDSSGAFRICGLPSSLQATLQARRGSAVTGEIAFALGDKPAQLFARTLMLSAADSGAKTGNAAVSGVVELEGSATNAGSRVELVGTDIVTMTNDKGEFTMHGLPSGSHVVMARHLGFGAGSVSVDLSSRQEKRVTMKLPKFVAIMDPVLVVARRSAALDRVGFGERKKSGFGSYIGPEQIQSMHPYSVFDILKRVPQLRVRYGPDGDIVTSARDGCVQYVLDDVPYEEMTAGDIKHFVTGAEVVAVEVYQGNDTPARYIRAGSSCTTVVIWTRFKIR